MFKFKGNGRRLPGRHRHPPAVAGGPALPGHGGFLKKILIIKKKYYSQFSKKYKNSTKYFLNFLIINYSKKSNKLI